MGVAGGITATLGSLAVPLPVYGQILALMGAGGTMGEWGAGGTGCPALCGLEPGLCYVGCILVSAWLRWG